MVEIVETIGGVEKSQYYLREYFRQEDLPLAFEDLAERTKSIVDNVSLKNCYRLSTTLGEYLCSLKHPLTPFFEKHPPEASVGTKVVREERKSAYVQEIRMGIKIMMDFEDFITQNPDITAEGLLAHYFEDKEGRLVPKKDITNKQAFCLLAMGMTYLLDHQILKLIEAEYGNDAGRVAKDFYGFELNFPKEARVEYAKDVGFVLYFQETDFTLFIKKREPDATANTLNSLGFYSFSPFQLGQLIGVKDSDKNSLSKDVILAHERDHLFFNKYRSLYCRLFCDYGDKDETKFRLLADPFAAELILGEREREDIKDIIAREISAFSLEGRTRRANLSVELERILPESLGKGRKNNPDLFSILDDFDQDVAEAMYPVIRKQIFIKFYRAIDICYAAISHGISPREISMAIAILGIDKIDRLLMLYPQLEGKNIDILYPDAFGKDPPYYGIYLKRYIPFMEESVLEDLERLFPDLKSDISSPEELRLFWENEKENCPALNLTAEQLRERYLSSGEISANLVSSPFEEAVVSCGRILFPSLSEDFFRDAFQAKSLFHPVFRFVCSKEEKARNAYLAPVSDIARLVKEVSLLNEKLFDERCRQLMDISKETRINYFPEVPYIPLLWAASRYPQDSKILEIVAKKFWPKTKDCYDIFVYKTLDGYKVCRVVWRILYLGFFHDYRFIREGNLTERKKKTRIAYLTRKWQRALEHLGIS